MLHNGTQYQSIYSHLCTEWLINSLANTAESLLPQSSEGGNKELNVEGTNSASWIKLFHLSILALQVTLPRSSCLVSMPFEELPRSAIHSAKGMSLNRRGITLANSDDNFIPTLAIKRGFSHCWFIAFRAVAKASASRSGRGDCSEEHAIIPLSSSGDFLPCGRKKST